MKLQNNRTHPFKALKHLTYSLLFLTPLLFSCGQSFTPTEGDQKREFLSLHNLLSAYYLYADSELNGVSSYQYNIEMLMGDIKDPFTAYYNPEEAKILLNNFTTPDVVKLMGIQTQIIDVDSFSYIIIYRVFRNSPAQSAGIQTGDTLVEINDNPLSLRADSLASQFSQLVAPDTVTLKVKRGDALISQTIVKEELIVPTVYVDSLTKDVSLIQITTFSDYTFHTPEEPHPSDANRFGTYDEFLDALDVTKGNQSTLIDLRGNPGGSVSQCANIASEFIDLGDTIITIEDHTSDKQSDGTYNIYYTAQTQGLASKRQFVLLADEGSASCAEIMIAALRSNRDIPLVGRTTYGKGIGQSFHYTYLSGIAKITSLGIFDKNLNSYHHVGILPDFDIANSDQQLAKALELATPSQGERRQFKTPSTTHRQILGDLPHHKIEGAYRFVP